MAKARFVPPLVVADDHDFVGRVFDLSMPLGLGFQSNKQLSRFPDCLYVMQVYWRLSFLIERVESLNMIRKMLMGNRLPKTFEGFPVTRYEWLTVSADVFLMRFVSVFDCCLLLANEVYECGIDDRSCNLDTLRKKGVPAVPLDKLKTILGTESALRSERNWRFHRGVERSFTRHDAAFRAMSQLEAMGRPASVQERGKLTDISKWFATALTKLRRECSTASIKLASTIPPLYDDLHAEFEARFEPKFRARKKPLPWYPKAEKSPVKRRGSRGTSR